MEQHRLSFFVPQASSRLQRNWNPKGVDRPASLHLNRRHHHQHVLHHHRLPRSLRVKSETKRLLKNKIYRCQFKDDLDLYIWFKYTFYLVVPEVKAPSEPPVKEPEPPMPKPSEPRPEPTSHIRDIIRQFNNRPPPEVKPFEPVRSVSLLLSFVSALVVRQLYIPLVLSAGTLQNIS